MKLSQFDTETGMQVLTRLTPYIGQITSDPELAQILSEKMVVKPDMTVAEQISELSKKLVKLAPVLHEKQRDAVLEIVAIMNEKSGEEVKRQPLFVTLRQLAEIFKDKDMLDFFSYCMGKEEGE